MPTTTDKHNVTIGGDAYAWDNTLTADGLDYRTPDMPAAIVGTAWDDTNTTTGTLTLPEGHGLSTGTFDLYWSGGSRTGVTATITDNSAAISGGSGDNLPADGTTMTLATQVTVSMAWVGANLDFFFVYSTDPCTITLNFDDASTAVIELDAAKGKQWSSSELGTNPYADKTLEDITVSSSKSGTIGATVNPITIAVILDVTN